MEIYVNELRSRGERVWKSVISRFLTGGKQIFLFYTLLKTLPILMDFVCILMGDANENLREEGV